MPNKKINELSPRTPSLTDLIIVGDPSTGYSYKATISVLTAFAGSNIQFSSLGGISLTSPANGQVLQFNGTSWVNYTPTTWNTAYDRSLVSAAVSGSTTKTLTLTKQDGSTLTATWSDLNTDAVTSVFGRTGAVVATEGDYSLDLLSDVTLSTPSTNQVLQYNGTAWVNATFVAGINSLNGLTATTQTFATGTSGTDFGISSTTSTHTFNLPTASGTNRGALSSADWTTFNSKVGGSGTTNYLSKWTSSSALGNSLVFDNGTSVGVNTATPSASYLLDVNGGKLLVNNSTNAYAGVFMGSSQQLIAHNPQGTKYNIKISAQFSADPYIVFSYGAGDPLATTQNFNFIEVGANNYSFSGFSSVNYNFKSGGSTVMQLTKTTNNLLIGTTTDAGYRLDVSGTFRSTGDANINGLTVGRGPGNHFTSTAVGGLALNSGSSGAYSTAVGRQSLEASTGQYNSALGWRSGAQITSGTENTAIGHQSLYSLTINSGNTAVGAGAGYFVSGSKNTLFGYGAGNALSSGSNNIFIGAADASIGVTTGSFNTIIGSQITGLSSSLSNTIILADGQGNQRLYIDASGDVGIGGAPSAWSTFTGVLQSGRMAFSNSLGGNAVSYLTSNIYFDGSNFRYIGTGYSFLQGYSQYDGAWYVSTYASGTAGNVLSGGANRMTIWANTGNVLINTTTDAGYKLDVNGTARVSGSELRLDNGTTGTINLYSATPSIQFFSGDPTGYRLYRSSTSMALSSGGTITLQISGNNGYTLDATNGHQWRTALSGGAALARLDTGGSLSIGNGSTAANASSILDLTSTTKGFLPPRMTNAQMTAIATPASGLTVYDTTNNKLNYYNGTAWVAL